VAFSTPEMRPGTLRKILPFLLGALFMFSAGCGARGSRSVRLWTPDRGDGTYRNPVLFADYSDPDVIRVGEYYYLVSSSFSSVPALPVLRSRDLVNWRIVAHVAARLPSPTFDTPQHGKGVWAPSLRHHQGRFWLYYGDPDLGIFMSTAERAEGPWEPPTLVQEARGWIDPCPLFDDDGSVWLVHAWAKSRAGFNGVLTMRRLSSDGRRILGEGTTAFEGGTRHPTIEGPKIYKRDGWYYIFAPAGGVTSGWQVVLRSRHVLGPYEDKVVLEQGTTAVNGPHQGAWVETAGGESWFLHFQERGAWGRVVHLQMAPGSPLPRGRSRGFRAGQTSNRPPPATSSPARASAFSGSGRPILTTSGGRSSSVEGGSASLPRPRWARGQRSGTSPTCCFRSSRDRRTQRPRWSSSTRKPPGPAPAS
jgi:hypothetical protein